MRRIRNMTGVGCVLMVALCIACAHSTQSTSMNGPQMEESPAQPEMAEYFANHNDQGMMSDMSIADIHFIPHTPNLSGAGEARLERYAELLATSGGTLCYDTRMENKELLDARLAMAREFLAHAVPGKNEVRVELGMAGGRGMTATESIAGQGIAKQPEPRGSAYKLNVQNSSSGGGG